MTRRPPRSTRTDTLFPSTTLFRSHRVGLLDADIYGPSQPRMMGISGRPTSRDGQILEPMENYGVKVMSMGFLVAEETPMIWRGPMVMSALMQMMRDVNRSEERRVGNEGVRTYRTRGLTDH